MTLPALLVLLALAPAGEPGALEVLDRMREAYRALSTYADEGEIVVETADGGSGHYRFETRYRAGRGSYLLERLGERSPDLFERPPLWVVRRGDDGIFLYDGKSDTYRSVASAGAALTAMLGADRRAAALQASLLLAGEDPMPSTLDASIARRGSCVDAAVPAGSRCWVIDVSLASGSTLRLHVDDATHLLRACELVEGSTRLTVRYAIAADSALADTAWTPPPTARAAASESAAIDQPAPEAESDRPSGPSGLVFSEEIDVRLSTITVRVIDAGGRPVLDLGPADFEVRVGGEPARVESVDWIGPETERFSLEELAELERSGVTAPPTGRLIVLFLQTDLDPSRAPGHLRLLPELEKLIGTFHADDQVAVVSFGTHLKLRQDFTRDHTVVEEAVARAVRLVRPLPIESAGYPSLERHFDADAARRAASPERALRVVADALLPLAGEKVLIFAGWGLGRYTAGSVQMVPEYDATRDALERANVTVFVLDVTQADYHSLEIGLEIIAEDTGGTYEKTFREPTQMTARLASTIAGYYEIGFTLPDAVPGRGRVDVDLIGRRKGYVLQRPVRVGG
jgi:VWFA-related protein